MTLISALRCLCSSLHFASIILLSLHFSLLFLNVGSIIVVVDELF